MAVENTCFTDGAGTLVCLERKAAALERQLREVQASAVALRAGILADEIASGSFVASSLSHEPSARLSAFSSGLPDAPEVKSPLPSVILAELPLHHSLRRKWNLVADFPALSADTQDVYDMGVRDDLAQEGQMRLFGLLPDGEPWECSIVYSNLMNDGGVTIGRDADYADVVLSDESVSRCHARLELTNRGLVVTDENTTNGTGINDMRLTHYDRQAMLNDGDLLNIADISLFVELI